MSLNLSKNDIFSDPLDCWDGPEVGDPSTGECELEPILISRLFISTHAHTVLRTYHEAFCKLQYGFRTSKYLPIRASFKLRKGF